MTTTAPASQTEHVCETPGCSELATLKCPTCLKLELDGALFCSQTCFKGYWKEHRKVHQVANKLNGADQQNNLVVWPGYHFSGKLRPHKQSATRTVPQLIQRPDYADDPTGTAWSEREAKTRGGHQMRILDDAAQEAMRLTCRLAREVLEEAAAGVAVGVTTDELDRLVHEACVERECYPSPLNYYGFPKSCCTSVNEVICHGIPDLRPLRDGELVNIDVTVFHRGFHGDLNETLFVGQVDDASRKLVETAHTCLWKAIDLVKPGVRYRDIGDVVQRVAQQNEQSVVRTYCGHGIHELFHCAPNVPHYAKNKAIGVMKVGHCFTIEPMINAGSWHDDIWPDKWTAVTRDGRRSAQFEETLLVTDDGVEVLTRRRQRGGQPYFKD